MVAQTRHLKELSQSTWTIGGSRQCHHPSTTSTLWQLCHCMIHNCLFVTCLSCIWLLILSLSTTWGCGW